MSTILVNNVKSYTGSTVTISGSNIAVQGNTTLGDGVGVDTVTIDGHLTASGDISASGDITAKNLTLSGNATITGNTTINGNLTFGNSDSDSVNFGAEISSSIIPDADDSYDLGSSGKQWKDLYVDGVAYIDTLDGGVAIGNAATIPSISSSIEVSGSILPNTGGVFALGTMARSWGSLHVHGLAHIHTASISKFSSSLIPHADDIYDLGSVTKQWKDLYIDGTANIDTLTSLTASINFFSSSLIPLTDDTYDLGSETKQWKDLYVDGTANIDTLSVEGIITAATISASSGISASGDITANGNINANGNIVGDNSTDILGIDSISATHVTASGNISASGTITAAAAVLATADINGGTIDGITALTAGGDLDIGSHDLRAATITADGLTATRVVFAGTAGVLSSDADLTFATDTLSVTKIATTHVTASGNISGSGTSNITIGGNITAASLTLDRDISSAVSDDGDTYDLNGKRGEIRSQLQGAVAADTGFNITLRNTSIAANSLIVANVIGGSPSIITGSVVTANIISANSASFNFFNTGTAIDDNAPFTASFAIF